LLISAVSGFLGSLLWVAEGKYISECASDDTKGFFFSYFWAFYMTSQILGNLLAALILGRMSQVSYFAIMAVVAFAASASFAFLKDPDPVAIDSNHFDIGRSVHISQRMSLP
jgi:MFS family permease